MLIFWIALAGVAFAPARAIALEALTDDAIECEPFDEHRKFAQLGPPAESGIDPVLVARDDARNETAGRIVTLPTGGAPPDAGQIPGEAILALPKGPGGALPVGVLLAPHARITESFFSPVMCATIARISGRPGDTPADLVPRVPDSAVVVPNHVYMSAAAEVRSLVEVLAQEPDPYRKLQWGVDSTGVEEARALSDGAGVRIAVLDSPPQREHRDLGPIHIAKVKGGPSDEPGTHGTLVIGLVNAVEKNGFGIAGLAPGAEMIAVPVCTPSPGSVTDVCPLFTVLKGLDLAWEKEADIVNLSIVGPDNPLLERGVGRLEALGALVVAAAGNEATTDPRYPAAYASVIGVGAHDRAGRMYARSNRGLSSELLAPGVDVLSTAPGDAFSFGSGTSFSAAHVTGTLAILLGAGIAPAEARTALFQQAHRSSLGSGPPDLPRVCDIFERLDLSCANAPGRLGSVETPKIEPPSESPSKESAVFGPPLPPETLEAQPPMKTAGEGTPIEEAGEAPK